MLDQEPSITIRGSNAFNKMTIQNNRGFYDSYAPYLRDLESTVRRCCSICESDAGASESDASDVVQESKEGTYKNGLS